MAIVVSLDWRHAIVDTKLALDPTGGIRLVLGHGSNEMVLRLSWDSLDALTLACLTLDRSGTTDAERPR